MLLLRVTGIGLLAGVLSPYVLVRPHPYIKIVAMALTFVFVLVLSRGLGKMGRGIEFTQQPAKTINVVRQSFVHGLSLLCVSAIMFLSYGVRTVYGPALPEIMLVPGLFLAAIGLALLLRALRKHGAR